ncbi:MAG TPA: hypothetical protein PK643_03345 [Saprospiraceae bacterium]|nr:hypothetical protein [Saprospiraceae bacterium]
MTIVQEIRDWFENGSLFFHGMDIYRRIGGDIPLSYFSGYSGSSYIPDDVRNRLKQCLINFLKENNSDTHKVIPAIFQKSISKGSKIVHDQEPDSIHKLRKKAVRLHKQHAMLHNNLRESSSIDDRYEICRLIMENVIPELDDIYDRIRIWEKTGDVPVVSDNEVIRQTVKKMERRLSLIPRISRLNKFIVDPALDDKLKKKYEKELLEKQIELKNINNELGIV